MVFDVLLLRAAGGQYGIPDFNVPFLDKLVSELMEGSWLNKTLQEHLSIAGYWCGQLISWLAASCQSTLVLAAQARPAQLPRLPEHQRLPGAAEQRNQRQEQHLQGPAGYWFTLLQWLVLERLHCSQANIASLNSMTLLYSEVDKVRCL